MADNRTYWTCPRCGEMVSNPWVKCWLCGTSVDGTEDPNFVTADEHRWEDPKAQQSPRQIPASAAFGLMIFFAVVLSLGPLISHNYVVVVLTMLVSAVLAGYLIIYMLYEVRK